MRPEDEIPSDEPPGAEPAFETLPPLSPLKALAKANGNHYQKKVEPRFEQNQDPSGADRELPANKTAELQVLRGILSDGEQGAETLQLCLEKNFTCPTFTDSDNRIIFSTILEIHARREPVAMDTLFSALEDGKLLVTVGKRWIEASQLAGSSAVVRAEIEKLIVLQKRRELIWALETARESAYKNDDVADLFTGIGDAIERIQFGKSRASRDKPKPLTDFVFPRPGDRSILLGNRYLNRGDGGVLVSTSGMGKSSMSIQMAITWSLGRDFFGIKPNGPLRSLIIQAEDSDGDIAEVWASVCHGLQLTEQEKVNAADRIRVVTDRVNRGPAFFHRLRGLVEKLKPDLVWINPLQSFMDGDLTQANDLGDFLRGGLNAINEPPSFGYIVVHHTTKPPQEKKDRQWNEVMYDMAGGAEIINWARFVMSLRANPESEGTFELVLAKRGKRAGVTKRIEAGLATHDEIQTKIGLKHASGTCSANGVIIPLIFWEAADIVKKEPIATGRTPASFSQYSEMFPTSIETAEGLSSLARRSLEYTPISKTALGRLLERSVEDGLVIRVLVNKQPRYYRKIDAL